jgi:hypothetical protein
MGKRLLALAATAALLALPALAGNIVLTGHDDDYHFFFGDANAGTQLGAMVTFAVNGSALPVLSILPWGSWTRL